MKTSFRIRQEDTAGILFRYRGITSRITIAQRNAANAQETAGISEEMMSRSEQMKSFVRELGGHSRSYKDR